MTNTNYPTAVKAIKAVNTIHEKAVSAGLHYGCAIVKDCVIGGYFIRTVYSDQVYEVISHIDNWKTEYAKLKDIPVEYYMDGLHRS